MSSRIEEIKDIIALAPADPFPRYGLAMACKAEGDLEGARAAFADLMERHPDYVAQYLMHGNMLSEMKLKKEAASVFDKGIEAARKARNTHALAELQAARDSLDENED